MDEGIHVLQDVVIGTQTYQLAVRKGSDPDTYNILFARGSALAANVDVVAGFMVTGLGAPVLDFTAFVAPKLAAFNDQLHQHFGGQPVDTAITFSSQVESWLATMQIVVTDGVPTLTAKA